MFTDITFIHTAEIHVETFAKLLANAKTDFTVKHIVNSELLESAMVNGISESLENQVKQLVLDQAQQSQLVVCSCSTLGGDC